MAPSLEQNDGRAETNYEEEAESRQLLAQLVKTVGFGLPAFDTVTWSPSGKVVGHVLESGMHSCTLLLLPLIGVLLWNTYHTHSSESTRGISMARLLVRYRRQRQVTAPMIKAANDCRC